MAKQKGILPLVGTLGGINFYYLNGKPVARKSGGGFSGKAIKTKASMQRVRENGREFGHCSGVNKVFRHALRPFYIGYTFTHFHSRLMGLFTTLKNMDLIHERGNRVVAMGLNTAEGAFVLKQFHYTPDCDVRQVLPFNFAVAANTFALSISEFDGKRVKFIAGATHIKLMYGVLDFNFDTLAFDLHLATPVVLDKDANISNVLLTPNSLPLGIGTPLSVLGVRFYQAIDGVLYDLQAKNALGFVVV